MLGRLLPRRNGCCLGCRLRKRILPRSRGTITMGEPVPAEAPRTVEGDVSKFVEIWTETRDADIPGGGMNRKRLMVPKRLFCHTRRGTVTRHGESVHVRSRRVRVGAQCVVRVSILWARQDSNLRPRDPNEAAARSK